MDEFRIISGKGDHCQKVLNQWRHDYNIKILQMCVVQRDLSNPDWVFILMTRGRKS